MNRTVVTHDWKEGRTDMTGVTSTVEMNSAGGVPSKRVGENGCVNWLEIVRGTDVY